MLIMRVIPKSLPVLSTKSTLGKMAVKRRITAFDQAIVVNDTSKLAVH